MFCSNITAKNLFLRINKLKRTTFIKCIEGGFLFSVYILQDFFKRGENTKEIGTFLKDKTEIYNSFLYSLLNYNGIKCKFLKPLGLERDFKLKAKQSGSIIYAPLIVHSSNSEISFIYTDCTESFSESFKIASLLRKRRSLENEEKVTFINPLNSTDSLADFSPVVLDILRTDDTDNAIIKDDPLILALITVKAFCEFYGVEFKSDNFMHI